MLCCFWCYSSWCFRPSWHLHFESQGLSEHWETITANNTLYHRRTECSTLHYYACQPHMAKWKLNEQIRSALMLSTSCHRCAFSFRFEIQLWSWGLDGHIMMNRDNPIHQALGVSVLLHSVSNTTPKNVSYISGSHCRHACWLWQFVVVLWCAVHFHKNCAVIRWWRQGAIISQGTCQTTHAATETLP